MENLFWVIFATHHRQSLSADLKVMNPPEATSPHQYRKGERKMKLFKAGTILQLIYCLLCLIVIICMPLYTAFYPTQFGEFCFKIGAVLTFVSTFNPLGLIGTIMNIVAYCTSDLKKSKKALIWAIVSPVLIVLCWVVAVCFFVHHSGGV